MEHVNLMSKLMDAVKKYRYVVLVLLIGIVLMLLPERQEQETQAEPEERTAPTQTSISQSLEEVLSRIEGAGEVEVMLSVATGEETVYQTNTEQVMSGESDTVKIETVLITDAQKNQSGVIRQINPEKYLGAIVVCQGADDPAVRLAIVQAVSNVTGLGTDRISVLKMK